MKMFNRMFQFLLGVLLSASLIFGLNKLFELVSTSFVAEINPTIVETNFIIQKEYTSIKINQTDPMEMIVTSYTAGPESTGKRQGMKGYGITRTGTRAKVGVCAVDPEYIPLGTSLYIDGYGYCRAEDTGGKVKGYHIDVFLDKVSDAIKFGRSERKVWILKDFEEEPM
jgi:3D (Asp-Asp-Asp) domain-containing protein